jgi:molecular chaperone DnaK
MKVIDHEGDNFLGGVDFDQLIVTQLFIPYLEKKYAVRGLPAKMQSANGPYNKLYFQLLYKAEEAKIALSNHPSAEVEFDFTDEAGHTEEVFFTIDRSQFNEIIQDKIGYSIGFIRKLLERNRLGAAAITEVVLVGGSTYIPLVRTLLAQELLIDVNTSIDPTTAVVEGAAYYAGSKASKLEKTPLDNAGGGSGDAGQREAHTKSSIEVKTAYAVNSREPEEYFAAAIKNAPPGSRYRIVRSDGGFDSGLKPVGERISEMLLLLANTLNIFHLKIYDQQGTPLNVVVPEITIVQGKFSIHGQPLPNDICLEVDDIENNTTHLEVIFERNDILPMKKSITKTLSRTILKGSDDQLLINVLEGSRYLSPQSNLPIGIVGITGKNLQADLIKGCDIDLSFEISESRDITVVAYISMIDMEVKEAFSPSARTVNLARMQEEVDYLRRVGERQLNKLLSKEMYKESAALQKAMTELGTIQQKLKSISKDDVTDTKYQLDDQKRRLAQVIDGAEKGNRILLLKEEYYHKKENYRLLLEKANNGELLRRFDALGSEENEWVNNCSTQFMRRKIDEMDRLSWAVKKKDVEYLTALYLYYAMKPNEAYSSVSEIKALKKRGDEALSRKNAEELLGIIYKMYDLLIDKNDEETIQGTGLRG